MVLLIALVFVIFSIKPAELIAKLKAHNSREYDPAMYKSEELFDDEAPLPPAKPKKTTAPKIEPEPEKREAWRGFIPASAYVMDIPEDDDAVELSLIKGGSAERKASAEPPTASRSLSAGREWARPSRA